MAMAPPPIIRLRKFNQQTGQIQTRFENSQENKMKYLKNNTDIQENPNVDELNSNIAKGNEFEFPKNRTVILKILDKDIWLKFIKILMEFDQIIFGREKIVQKIQKILQESRKNLWKSG